ncbi:MAG: helix-turn-helix domain-containing protein [Phycisphaerales bacterium]|nr:helix-turn-helix domain-containing protein [Phycisphaerales bacterium]
MNTTQLLTVRTAATLLSLSTRTVQSLISRGDLRVVRIGRSVRIHPDDLNAYINRHRGTPGGATR